MTDASVSQECSNNETRIITPLTSAINIMPHRRCDVCERIVPSQVMEKAGTLVCRVVREARRAALVIVNDVTGPSSGTPRSFWHRLRASPG